ncbi:GreA/GreB family elongation factor, partial [bacterium]|nr:GreA/GreB family elongation factor [bacterium]
LNAAAQRGDYDALENSWLELLDVDALPAEELGRLLDDLIDDNESRRALDLAMALAPELVRGDRYAEALPILSAIAPVANGDEEVRACLLDCYRDVYAHRPHLGACIDASGLLTDPNIGVAAATLDRLVSYEVGDYFYHASGWGVGSIASFDVLSAAAFIDFEERKGHRVPLLTIEGIFTPLAKDSFRVLRITDSEGLRAMATADAPRLVRLVLRSYGGRITLRSLKNALSGDVIPATTWTRWWTSARTKLKRDPHVDITTGASAILTLRDEALTYEEEMRVRFDALRDLTFQVAHVRDYIQHMARDADRSAFLEPAAAALAEGIGQTSRPGEAFEAAILLSHLNCEVPPHASPAEVLALQEDPILLLNQLATREARRLAFDSLKVTSENWPATCRDILTAGPRELWESAFADLPIEGDAPTVGTFVDEVLADPKVHIDLFAWLSRLLLAKRCPVERDDRMVFEKLLAEGNVIARRKEQRRVADSKFAQDDEMAACRLALRAGNLAYFDRILDASSETEAARLLLYVRQSSILTPQLHRTLESSLTRRYPSLLIDEEAARITGPQFIYATPEGIAMRVQEHEHLVNVLIPQNSEDIGRAAAQGDISDNADWRSAIEEQGRLTSLAGLMTQELQLARPIDASMVSKVNVSVGSRVTLECAETGEQATYSLLGVWDANSELGIIAYTAPLAQALIGHKPGEEVTLDHAGEQATYRILALSSALDALEQDE